MRPPRNLTAGLCAAALALSLTACGDDGDDEADEATTTTVEADEATTTTAEPEEPEQAEATTTTVSEEGLGAVESLLQDLLVTTDELGEASFVDVGYTPSEGPNVCGAEVDVDVPPSALVGTQLESSSLELAFQQELRGYPSIDEAGEAFDIGREGTSCGTSEDGTLTLSEPEDVTDRVGGDRAFAVAVSGEGVEGVLVAALVTDVIATFQFAGTPGASAAAGAPEPLDVAAFGVGKLLAYLEG